MGVGPHASNQHTPRGWFSGPGAEPYWPLRVVQLQCLLATARAVLAETSLRWVGWRQHRHLVVEQVLSVVQVPWVVTSLCTADSRALHQVGLWHLRAVRAPLRPVVRF